MDIPRPLTIDDCPLLKKHLDRLEPILKLFAEAVSLFQVLRDRYPQHLKQPDVHQRLLDLLDEAERLTRPRYLVGFLGTSGSGKSATLNSVLKVLGKDGPSKEGAGEATTSVITRLQAARQGAHSLRIRYFNDNEYRHRRDTLCSWLGLPNTAGKTEAMILDDLRKGLPPLPAGAQQRKRLPEDEPYLRDLLESYKDYNDLVKVDAYEKPDPPYDRRDDILNHVVSKEKDRTGVSKYKLLAESEIGYRTDEISHELEMIDCPGFGATKSVDTLITLDFIPKLDGALLILRADHIFSNDVVQILEHLKQNFRDKLQSRVWVVVNKFDVPTREAKFEGRTVFDIIADLEQKHGIPLSQVCLTSRIIYKEMMRDGSMSRERALDKINLLPTDPVPPRCAAHPPLAAAFEELLKDGGISNLRHIIKEVMAPSVAQEICSAAQARLAEIVGDLKYAVQQARSPISQEEKRKTIQWRNAILKLIYSLEMRNPWIEEKGTGLKGQLEKLFQDNLDAEVFARMKPEALLREYDIHARDLLVPELQNALNRTIQEVYTHVTEQLQQRNLPAIELPNGRQPLEEWASYRQEDRDNPAWREKSMPRLYQPDLLARLADPRFCTTFNSAAYQRLMLDKLRLAVHQVIHAVRGQVRKRLRQLEHHLNRKIWTPEDEKGVSAVVTAAP